MITTSCVVKSRDWTLLVDIKMIFGFILIGLSAACVFTTLASMFNGKAARTVRSAGAATVMGVITIIFAQNFDIVPESGLKGVGWITSFPRTVLLAMLVIGITLLVVGALSTLMIPVPKYQDITIMGGKHKPSDATLRRQVGAFGQRIKGTKLRDPAEPLLKNDSTK